MVGTPQNNTDNAYIPVETIRVPLEENPWEIFSSGTGMVSTGFYDENGGIMNRQTKRGENIKNKTTLECIPCEGPCICRRNTSQECPLCEEVHVEQMRPQ